MTTVVIPRPHQRAAPALVRDSRYRVLQSAMFVLGALLLPLGLFVIGIGWWGAAHTTVLYDQLSFLISGGLLGLGLTFAGGFLYFGAWLAAAAASQRETTRQLSETVLALADAVTRLQTGRTPDALVVAGDGRTVHRGDCALITHRTDLRPISGTEPDLTLCRVCQPLA